MRLLRIALVAVTAVAAMTGSRAGTVCGGPPATVVPSGTDMPPPPSA